MPNHCENDLYFSGDALEVAHFKKLVGLDKEPSEFDCGAIIPYPAKLKQMDEEAYAFDWFNKEVTSEQRDAAREAYKAKWGTEANGFNSGGYEWCCKYWGTKWGAYAVELLHHPKRGEYVTFQSAWSPPIPVIEKLFELFPTMKFVLEYFECGAAYQGGISYDPEALKYEEDPVRRWSGEYRGDRGG